MKLTDKEKAKLNLIWKGSCKTIKEKYGSYEKFEKETEKQEIIE